MVTFDTEDGSSSPENSGVEDFYFDIFDLPTASEDEEFNNINFVLSEDDNKDDFQVDDHPNIQAKMLRETLGGGMRQVGFICASAYVALQENVGKLDGDHKKAKIFAD